METSNINIMMENAVKIIQILVTVMVAFLTAYFTNKNERKKQTTVFFKQEGIKVQKEILEFWCSILFNDYKNTVNSYIKNNSEKIIVNNSLNKKSEITETMAIIEVQKASYMYSSKSTIKYIGFYMQEVFKDKKRPKEIKQLFLVSKIISNMKNDFTGEKTSTMHLLKIKINDLNIKRRIQIWFYEIKYFLAR